LFDSGPAPERVPGGGGGARALIPGGLEKNKAVFFFRPALKPKAFPACFRGKRLFTRGRNGGASGFSIPFPWGEKKMSFPGGAAK